MTEEQLDEIRDIVDSEGFQYAIQDYSTFRHIEDVEFHRRRDNFVRAAEELQSYLGV